MGEHGASGLAGALRFVVVFPERMARKARKARKACKARKIPP